MEHSRHPEHAVHLHFFSQPFSLLAHQGLHGRMSLAVVVVASCAFCVVDVAVVVVVSEYSPPLHEQHGVPAVSFTQLLHEKNPPCKTQALTRASNSQASSGSGSGSGSGSETEDVAEVTVNDVNVVLTVDIGAGTGVGTGVCGEPGTHCEYHS